MCGIFGFISKGAGPDIDRLQRIAAATETRGAHAFGLAWIAGDGRLHHWKRPGAATANVGDLGRVRDARIVLGHCRWATHGSPADNRNNHPHRAGAGLFVHNGVVRNYADLAWRYEMATECDSEVLGHLLAAGGGTLLDRGRRMASAAEGRLAMLGVWKPGRLLVVRNGNPLCAGEAAEGVYFASLMTYLPNRRVEVADGTVHVLECRDSLTIKSSRILSQHPRMSA